MLTYLLSLCIIAQRESRVKEEEMHSDGLRVFSRMSKAVRRRWIVRFVELCIYMTGISIGCVLVALAVSQALRLLGVG